MDTTCSCPECKVEIADDGMCPKCGVDFTDPCGKCGQAGFHAEDCEDADPAEG